MIDNYEALFNSKYMRWFNLNEKPALVEIVSVAPNVEMVMPGGKKEKRPVLHFKQINGKIEDVKPMVLNRTNGNKIAEIHGVKPSQWKGKEIVLFQDVTKFGSKDVNCIRIRARKVK